MYPKGDIKKLNRRRELNRRLRFVQKRMVEVAFEFLLAQGKIPALPEGMEEPPEWALSAARWVAENCLKPPTAEDVTNDAGGVWMETIGRYEGLLAYVTQAGKGGGNSDEARRVLTKLQKFTSKLVPREPLDEAKQLDLEIERILPPMTATEIFEFNERRIRGISSVVNSEGELQVLKTDQAEIYYLIWFFWPKIHEMIPSITAAKVGTWLSDNFELFTSLETVEIVYARLGLASFKKPANPST